MTPKFTFIPNRNIPIYPAHDGIYNSLIDFYHLTISHAHFAGPFSWTSIFESNDFHDILVEVWKQSKPYNSSPALSNFFLASKNLHELQRSWSRNKGVEYAGCRGIRI